jgi:X-domain of DnaJ-containing
MDFTWRLLQQDREFALAKQLALRLHQFVAGDEESFKRKIREEALILSRLPFGIPLLHKIGCADATYLYL